MQFCSQSPASVGASTPWMGTRRRRRPAAGAAGASSSRCARACSTATTMVGVRGRAMTGALHSPNENIFSSHVLVALCVYICTYAVTTRWYSSRVVVVHQRRSCNTSSTSWHGWAPNHALIHRFQHLLRCAQRGLASTWIDANITTPDTSTARINTHEHRQCRLWRLVGVTSKPGGSRRPAHRSSATRSS